MKRRTTATTEPRTHSSLDSAHRARNNRRSTGFEPARSTASLGSMDERFPERVSPDTSDSSSVGSNDDDGEKSNIMT